jgi:RIO kinase 1
MLAHNLIHGDLSAYNILYWRGEITLIDFPQVVDSRHNESARPILKRDIQRVCDYFSAQGVKCDADAIAGDLWGHLVGSQLNAQLADLSMAEYRRAESEQEQEWDEEGAVE